MESRFRAMNTDIFVKVNDELADSSWCETVFEQFRYTEKAASRFLADSELSRWNAAPVGVPFAVSDRLYNLLSDAWWLAAHTDFKFNPFVGSTLKHIGYDRSFELIERTEGTMLQFSQTEDKEEEEEKEEEDNPKTINRTSAHDLELSAHDRTVTKHRNVDVDLGGIGKGWTVDRVYEELNTRFQAVSGVIDAGGDMRVWSEEEPWQVGIQHPSEEEKELVQLWVKHAAIATSNVLHRRWKHQGKVQHHIIDGQTMRPASSDIVQATVLGPSAAEAEVAAKIICMLPAGDVNGWMSTYFAGYGYIFATQYGDIKLNREVRNYVEELR